MSDSIGGYVVPVDYLGNWTPAHQINAWHTARPFVEVSRQQFFAVIGPMDIVTSAVGDYEKGYGRFATRWGDVEVGRIYSGRNSEPSNYVLTRAFAERHRAVLEANMARAHRAEECADEPDVGERFERQRN